MKQFIPAIIFFGLLLLFVYTVDAPKDVIFDMPQYLIDLVNQQ